MSFTRRLLGLSLAALGLAAAANAAEPAIIAKARAFLGTEAALNGVKSVHYVGTVVTTLSGDASKQSKASVEIIVQKPDQQRITAKSEKQNEVTGLDGYEAWQRVEDPANPKNWRGAVFKPDAVKRLRAQTWENLSFYRGIERNGGRIEDQGMQTVEGVACHKIAFIHAPNIIFYRYFDSSTGRLVQTETEDGGISREHGEFVVSGVRFPKSMTIVTKTPNGGTQTVSVTFEKITVNETFPPTLFRVPAPTL